MTEPRTYRIIAAGQTVDLFRTAGCPGAASADENAVGNLIDYSLHHGGLLTLEYVQGPCTTPIAEARLGLAEPLVDPEAIASDAMHCGPNIVAVPTDVHAALEDAARAAR